MLRPALTTALLLLLAQGAARADSKVEQAKKLFEAAEVHYRLGEFRQAVDSYRAAMRLAPRPNILFNIAQCFRQLKDSGRALFYYRLYLSDWRREHPGERPPFEREVKEHVRRLEELERRPPQSRPASSVPAALPSTRPAPPAQPAPRVTAPPAREDPGGSGLWLGLGIGTAGLAVASEVLALVFTFKARERYTDEPEFETYRGVAIAGHVAAATMAAASIVSWVLYVRSRSRTPGSVDIAVGPGGIVGRF